MTIGGDFAAYGPLPLITNNGEYLVVVAVEPAMSGDQEALRVYRMRNGSYQFEKSAFIRDLLTPTQIDPGYPHEPIPYPPAVSATDASPQWFAGGSFRFDEASKHLVFQTRWGNVVSVQLAKN